MVPEIVSVAQPVPSVVTVYEYTPGKVPEEGPPLIIKRPGEETSLGPVNSILLELFPGVMFKKNGSPALFAVTTIAAEAVV